MDGLTRSVLVVSKSVGQRAFKDKQRTPPCHRIYSTSPKKIPSPRGRGVRTRSAAPLAHRMRPRTLDDFVGQERVLGPGKPLRQWIESDRVPSLVLWGPPGCGKTTLSQIIAQQTLSDFESLSAVLSGVKDIKEAVERAKQTWRMSKRKTILFVDEIHRFNKSQQDALLPHVENGTVTLIGATTENPSFELNTALLSRTRVIRLERLGDQALERVIERALEGLRARAWADFCKLSARGDRLARGDLRGRREARAHGARERRAFYAASGARSFLAAGAVHASQGNPAPWRSQRDLADLAEVQSCAGERARTTAHPVRQVRRRALQRDLGIHQKACATAIRTRACTTSRVCARRAARIRCSSHGVSGDPGVRGRGQRQIRADCRFALAAKGGRRFHRHARGPHPAGAGGDLHRARA